MAVTTITKTIGTGGDYSTPALWEAGSPSNLTTAEKSDAGTFLVATFIIGETLTFVQSGTDPVGKLLATDSTGVGTGTYILYGLTSGNPVATAVVTGGTSGATCVLTSSTPTDVGVIWRGECKNQEFTAVALVLGNTGSSTCYYELTTQAGASFRDNANKLTNALKYNASNGCGFLNTGSSLVLQATSIGARVSNLQIANTGTGQSLIAGASSFCDNLILEGKNTTFAIRLNSSATLRNSLVVQRATGSSAIIAILDGGSPFCYNCTFAAPDDLATAPTAVFSTGTTGTTTAQNCGLFAGDSTKAVKSGTSTINFTTSYSDISGTAGVTQCTYANEFENVNDATIDYRLKTGAAEINTGTTDPTNAAFDIVGTARPQGSAYDVSCWELVQASFVFFGFERWNERANTKEIISY